MNTHFTHATQSERRSRPDIRAIFAEILELLMPYYPPAASQPMDYWAARVLHESYPELDVAGVQIALVAVRRVLRERLHAEAA